MVEEVRDIDASSKIELLEIIASCIEGTNLGATRTLNVSIQNSSSKLNNTIENSVKSGVKNANQEGKKDLRDILNDNRTKERDILKGMLKNLIENNNKGIWSAIDNFINKGLKYIPIVGELASGIYKVTGEIVKLQLKNINDFREINNAGVLYREDMKKFHEYASDIGVYDDELKNALIKNSEVIARLNGVTGDGIKSFKKLFENAKKTSDSIGLNLNDSVEVISLMAKNSYDEMDIITGRLNDSTEKYMKTLKTLSYWTGKSTESLIAQEKKREDDVVYRLWVANNKSAPLLNTLLESVNAPDDLKADIARGMNTGSLSRIYAINEEEGRFFEKIMEWSQNNVEVTDEMIDEHIKSLDTSKLQKILNFDRNVTASFGKDFQSYMLLGMKLGQLSPSGWEKTQNAVVNPDDSIKGINEIATEIKSALETVKAGLSWDKDTVEKLLITPMKQAGDAVDEFRKKLEGYLKSPDKSEFLLDEFLHMTKEHPFITGLVSAFMIAFGLNSSKTLAHWLAMLVSANLFGQGLGVFGGPSGKAPRGMVSKLQQQQYKQWARSHPESKYMTNDEKLKQYKNFAPSKAGNFLRSGGNLMSLFGTVENGFEMYDDYQSDDYKNMAKNAYQGLMYLAGGYYALGAAGSEILEAGIPAMVTDIKENAERAVNRKINEKEWYQFSLFSNNLSSGEFGRTNTMITSDRVLQADNMKKHYDEEEKKKQSQAEEMKSKEKIEKELQQKKEELQTKYQEIEQENNKTNSEYLRSIDTKLNILMNLDGKYDVILDEAHNLRINQELAGIDEIG